MECKWIKVIVDFFDDEKILLIEKMKNGDTIIVIWLKLLTLAGKLNSRGVFKVSDKIPYTVDLFAAKFRRPEKQIKMAFEVFEQL